MRFFIFLILNIALFAEPITPIPLSVKLDQEKVKLGKELFFDTRLSKNDTISCATCHDIYNGGDDNLKSSFGIKAQQGDINSPTVLNAVYNFRQFWNGSAKDLQDQAQGPITNPIEMGNNFKDLIKKLNKTDYKSKFSKIYKDGITKENITDAIAEFEKSLITPNAPFDKFLRGDKDAISKDAKEGYELFKSKGCIACHHGINIGGNLYNKFGVMQDTTSKRLGRYEVTHNEKDKYYFKVPTLRNISKTAPYLHDGRYNNLEDVVRFMAQYQLGRVITEDEVKKIVAFLKSLDGELPQSMKEK